MSGSPRFSAASLERFASGVLTASGLDHAAAEVVASTLLDADLMGHDTHGLALLAPYLDEIAKGSMTRSGEPRIMSDRDASLLWDGMRLPGPWLVRSGIDALMPRARKYGSATLVIRRSHHIACLASYARHAAEAGFMLVLASSDPSVCSVAPHGGTRAVFTPNPIAIGIPTSGTPFLVDISSSLVTNGMSARLHKASEQFDEPCLFDAAGHPSRDPSVLMSNPAGSIMPLGGPAFGHKGFGLALLVEALTGGLAGHGRADPPEGWGATVFVSLYDPEAFGGLAALARQADWLGAACRDNPPRPGFSAVRMPGDRGLSLRQAQLRDGVALHPSIVPMLQVQARRFGNAFPDPLPG